MRVLVPSALHRYTGNKSEIHADGATLGAVLTDLERQYPGLLFRILDEQDNVRPHINIFLNNSSARDLKIPVRRGDTLHILLALSGG